MEILALVVVVLVAALVLIQAALYRRQRAGGRRIPGSRRIARWCAASLLALIAIASAVLAIRMDSAEYLPLSLLVIVSAGLMFSHRY